MAYNLGTAEGRIVIDGSGAEKGFNVAKAAASGFASAVSAKVDQVRTLGERLTAVGAAGVAGFGLAVKAASSFEAELSGIKAVSGATSAEMDKISALALKLGKDTVFSASEAAQAIQELVKAGVPLEDVLNGAADATVNLAAAGGISLPEAATIASAAMNQFNLSGQQLPKVADMIAAAANASAIDVSDFGMSLQQAGGVANLVGLSFDDLSVAIAEMGKQGYRGSDAGTSLKTMFLNLNPVTKQQTDLFEKLGLMTFSSQKALEAMAKNGIQPVGNSLEEVRSAVADYLAATRGIPQGTREMSDAVDKWLMSNGAMQNAFFDTSGKIKPLADMQQVLQDSLKGMTDQQKTASLEILFGSDAIRAAAVMAKNGADGFNTLSDSMKGISAADVAKTRMDNLKGSVEQFKGSLETAQIIIGQTVIPVVRLFVDGLTALLNVFNSLPTPVQKAIGVLFAIATVLSLVSGAFFILLTVLPAVLGKMLLFRTLNVAIASIREFYLALRAGEGVGAAITAMTGPWMKFGRTLRILIGLGKAMRLFWIAVTGPIGLIVIAIAAVVAAFIYCYTHIKWFHDAVDKIVRAIGEFFRGLWDGIINGAKAIGNFFSGPFLDFFKAIPEWFKAHWPLILAILTGPFGLAVYWIVNHWSQIVDFFKGLPGKIGGALGDFGGWIGGIFAKGWNAITSALSTAWDATMSFLGSLPSKLVYGLGWLAGTVTRAAIDGFHGFVDGAVSAWNAVWDFFANLPGRVANWFIGLGTGIAGWAVDAWHSVSTSAVDAWNGLIDWLTALPARIGNWFLNLGISIATWAINAWHSLTTSGQDAGNGLMSWLSSLPARIGNWFVGLGVSILNWAINAWNNITNGAVTAWNATWAWITGLPAAIGNAFVDAGHWLLEAGTNIILGLRDGIVNGWNAFWDWIVGLWDSFIQGFKDAMGISSPSTVFMQFGMWLIEGLWNGVVDKWNGFWAWFSTLPESIKNLFVSAAGWLVNYGVGLLQGFWNGVVDKWNGFWGWLTSLPGSIIGVFAAAGSWLANAGRALLEGLWEGIKAAAGWLVGKLKDWATGILNNIKSFFGIHSPSKVFAGFGKFMMQGLAQGINTHGDLAVNEAIRMATAITNGFHDNLPNLQAMLSANLEYLGPNLRSQLASDLAGLQATLGTPGVSGRIPASQEVQDYAKKVENNFVSNVFNPVAEKASDSEARRLRAVSAIGAFSK
jgi:hypothetical protein